MAVYNWRVSSGTSTSTSFDFSRVVDTSHVVSTTSPIDQFINKNRELNSLLLDPNNFKDKIQDLHTRRRISNRGKIELEVALFDRNSISPVLANLVLLGHISAVESYFREIFRRLILIDEATQKTCYEKMLNYGAVLVHDKESLPDALLELISFSSKRNITETLREFFGVKGKFPVSLDPILAEFSKICQLRHSIVHKFGTLGSNNIKHDISSHRTLVNKPIKTDFSTIQEVAQICWNLVHEINHLLWQNSMMKSIATFDKDWKKRTTVSWQWKWRKDKKQFQQFYSIFFSSLSGPSNPDAKAAYIDLENTFKTL